MSALTLLIWERWDFSSSRSSSSRCAFFMASMAAWEGTELARRAALPKGGFLGGFLKEREPSHSSEPSCRFAAPSVWAPGKGASVKATF